jgi:hypothetical protein
LLGREAGYEWSVRPRASEGDLTIVVVAVIGEAGRWYPELLSGRIEA